MDYYVPKRLTPDTKHAKVESGFGLCQNEANLDKSRNEINVCDSLAKSWTKPNQGMTKFPMQDGKLYDGYMDVNEPEIGGNNSYPSNINLSARNPGKTLGTGVLGTAIKYSNNPD